VLEAQGNSIAIRQIADRERLAGYLGNNRALITDRGARPLFALQVRTWR